MVVDPDGNAFVAWTTRAASGATGVMASRYRVDTEQWAVATPLPTLVAEPDDPVLGVDAGGNAMAVWRVLHPSLGGGALFARWDGTSPSPAISAVAPSANALHVSLAPPATSLAEFAPTNYEYSLDGGATWTARSVPSTSSPWAITGLTDGVVYALAIRAVNRAGVGTATATLAARSGVNGAPTGLRVATVEGNTVTLTWVAPAAGLVPTAYLLEGGTAPQQTLASLPTGSPATLTTVTLPSGRFFARVVAMTESLRGGTSNEIPLIVTVPAVPSAPAALLGLVNGSLLSLSWINTYVGGAPEGIQLSYSGALTGTATLPFTESFSFAGVPAGTYTFQLTALNGAGASAPSNPLTLVFPGACSGAPLGPTDFSASASGNRVHLHWSPPGAGPAVTGYVLRVIGAFTGSLPVSSRTLSATVGTGSYTVSVIATNACGQSPETPGQTLVVP